MLNIIQNTIGAIRRVGESVVRAGLKMWLPFTKAEPLGKELITNGDFSTDSDWTKEAGWNIQNGKATKSGSTSSALIQNIDIPNGRVFQITFNVSGVNNGHLKAELFGGGGNDSFFNILDISNGSYSFTTTTTTDRESFQFYAYGNFDGSIDNVSIKELTQETPDISGNDNNAILKTGKALQFTGNDSVQTSFPSSYTIKTIAFWIKPTHSSTNETVFYGGGGMGGTRQLYLDHLQLEAINSNISMSTYVNGTLEGVTANGTPATLTQDEWQRVVLTSSTGFTVVSDTFDIGSGLYGSDGRFIMSDLQIYNETWTTDDIIYDYANPQKLVTDSEDTSITLDNLKAWWHMSEGDGTVAFDSAPLLGVEEITNGTFESDSDWIVIDGGWTISNNEACHTGSASFIEQNTNLISGRTYKVVWTISSHTNQSVGISSHSGTRSGDFSKSAEGTYVAYLVSNGNNFRFFSTGDNCISNVSVKEVYNIDGETYDGSSLGASYVDAQERIPQLGMMNWSKGSNLIEYSEDFSSSYWATPDITLESGYLAPDGTLSAYKVSADTITSVINRQFSGIGSYYRSIWAKTTAGTGTVALLTRHDSTGSGFTITNEWQRFSINSADSLADYFYVVDFRGGNLDEVILWGAQLEDADSVSAYRRTNGTAVTGATLISSATDSQKDILGNAVRVKGSGFNLDGTGYAEVLDDNVFDVGVNEAFSICGWAKWKYVSQGTGTLNTIYAHGDDVGSDYTFSVNSRYIGSANKVSVWIWGSNLDSTTTYTEGDWFYFALTRQAGGGNNKNTLYTSKVDGNGNWVVTSEGSFTNNLALTNSFNKTIGWDGKLNDRKYHDLIDDIKFYDRELSLEEIEQNFNATKSGHNN